MKPCPGPRRYLTTEPIRELRLCSPGRSALLASGGRGCARPACRRCQRRIGTQLSGESCEPFLGLRMRERPCVRLPRQTCSREHTRHSGVNPRRPDEDGAPAVSNTDPKAVDRDNAVGNVFNRSSSVAPHFVWIPDRAASISNIRHRNGSATRVGQGNRMWRSPSICSQRAERHVKGGLRLKQVMALTRSRDGLTVDVDNGC
jgi:hypothetical protein